MDELWFTSSRHPELNEHQLQKTATDFKMIPGYSISPSATAFFTRDAALDTSSFMSRFIL